MKNKKILSAIVLAAVTVCVFAGCGGSSEKTITGDVQNQVTKNGDEEAENDADLAQSADSVYVFSYKGVDIKVMDEAQPVLDSLGEPNSYFEAASCAFGDLDKLHTYSGFELDTYQEKGTDYVSAVILQDDSVSTPEGLSIGDPADKAKELYGNPTEDLDGDWVYRTSDMKLVIKTKEDKVISIEYLNTVLD